MMKNWKKIVVLGAVLVVLVGAFIFLSLNKDKLEPPKETPTETTSPDDEIKPVDFVRESMNKIILKRDSGEIVLTKVEKEIEQLQQKEDGSFEKVKEKKKVWTTSGFDVNSSKVDDLALAAETVKTTRLIDANPQDVSIFGLDKASVVTVMNTDGKEVSLEIGNLTPTGDSYYFRKGGSPAVYTIDKYKGDTLLYGKLDILSKYLYGTEAVVPDDITSLKISKSGQEVLTTSLDDSTSTWYISSPIQHKADIADLTYFLQWLAEPSIVEYVAENPADLKTYGLDKPRYTYEYHLAGKDYKLMLGSLSDDKYYAQLEGSPFVFTLRSSDLNFIDKSLLDLTDQFIYIPNIADVEKLVIEMDGRRDELLIKYDVSDEGTVEEFSFNGTKIEEDDFSLFKKYYQGAIGLRGTKIDLEAEPSGKADIRLTYTMENPGNDGKVVVVELIPAPDGYGYYLMKNGVYSKMVMSARELDKDDGIRAYYKGLIEGIQKE